MSRLKNFLSDTRNLYSSSSAQRSRLRFLAESNAPFVTMTITINFSAGITSRWRVQLLSRFILVVATVIQLAQTCGIPLNSWTLSSRQSQPSSNDFRNNGRSLASISLGRLWQTFACPRLSIAQKKKCARKHGRLELAVCLPAFWPMQPPLLLHLFKCAPRKPCASARRTPRRLDTTTACV